MTASTATANGGRGGLGVFSFPKAEITGSPSVAATIAAGRIEAGADLVLLAASDFEVQATADTAGGGVVGVGKSQGDHRPRRLPDEGDRRRTDLADRRRGRHDRGVQQAQAHGDRAGPRRRCARRRPDRVHRGEGRQRRQRRHQGRCVDPGARRCRDQRRFPDHGRDVVLHGRGRSGCRSRLQQHIRQFETRRAHRHRRQPCRAGRGHRQGRDDHRDDGGHHRPGLGARPALEGAGRGVRRVRRERLRGRLSRRLLRCLREDRERHAAHDDHRHARRRRAGAPHRQALRPPRALGARRSRSSGRKRAISAAPTA